MNNHEGLSMNLDSEKVFNMKSNQCPQCGKEGVTRQPLTDGKKRAQCSTCGWSEVYDERGKRQLLEVPPNDSRRLLTETTA